MMPLTNATERKIRKKMKYQMKFKGINNTNFNVKNPNTELGEVPEDTAAGVLQGYQ